MATNFLDHTNRASNVTCLAINLIKRRLKDAFGADAQFEERGQPTDFGSAKALAELDKWQFQQWALSLIDARPRTEGDGKGADRGVDGMLYFYEGKDKREKILVQVKGGGVQRNDVSTLLAVAMRRRFRALAISSPSFLRTPRTGSGTVVMAIDFIVI
jgi:site-specific DNA-methyltransferase (adenine-specific)